MTASRRHPVTTLRLVEATGSNRLVERGAAVAGLYLVADDRQRASLIKSMDFAIATRSLALQRLRHKSALSRMLACGFTLGLGAIAVSVAIWPPNWLWFMPSHLVVGILALAVVALIAESYAARLTVAAMNAIASLAECVSAIERARATLLSGSVATAQQLSEARQRYLDARQQCDVRYAHIDYLGARVLTGRTTARWRWRLAYAADVFVVPAALVLLVIFAFTVR